MRLKIQDEPVRQNLEMFLQILRKVREKQTHQPTPVDKVFNAWLNRKTGQFSFAEVSEKNQYLGKQEWKPVQFMYHYDQMKGEIAFFVYEAEEKRDVFHSQDLTADAFKILQKTMKVFSQITQQLKGPSDLDTKISVLSRLIISPGVSHRDKNIIIDLWHEADRMEAESLLADFPVGTYFFRKDPYAQLLEQQLERQLGKKIKCYTLTYSQENNRVTDHTLVLAEGDWQIYNDDPSLNQQRFSNLDEIITLLKGVLKYPLYRSS